MTVGKGFWPPAQQGILRLLVSQIVIPMPHQPQRVSVRFRQKPRASSAQRLILRKDYVELNFQFLTLARQVNGKLLG